MKINMMNEIYPNFKEPQFRSTIRFELVSWFGRHFKKGKSKITPRTSPLLLDIGVGNNYVDGWTHVDFFQMRIRFWKKYPKKYPINRPEIETDLRYPLNCADEIVDGVYSGHTLEHLYPFHAYQLLTEIFRILKPKSWLRINVPDLKYAIEIYNGNIHSTRYKFKAEAISGCTQNWGHHSAWDEELLTYALKTTGFVNVREVEFGIEGTDKRLIKEKESRREGTLVIEAQKP